MKKCVKDTKFGAKLLNRPVGSTRPGPGDFVNKFSQEDQKEWTVFIRQLQKKSHKDFAIDFFKKVSQNELPASSPRHIAAMTGNLEIMEILASYISDLNAPCRVNMTYRTPLLTAVKYNQTEMARFLVPFCENPNLPDQYGWTPLHAAVVSEWMRRNCKNFGSIV